MRYHIYYRKCDKPDRNLFKDKYSRGGIEHLVRQVCPAADEIRPLNCDGNHYAYYIRRAGREMLFRADTAAGDHYMLAETALMRLAGASGVPVPEVFECDTSRTRIPCDWQLLQWIPFPNLEQINRGGKLDQPRIARQLGVILKKLHSVKLDGFGFLNTDLLARDNRIEGIYSGYRDYFFCRLEDHLHSLNFHTDRIRSVLGRLPELSQGSLVHRDPALWNLLGNENRIAALIDWDDAVSGDPADDIGMLRCFHDRPFMDELFDAYGENSPQFHYRADLHYLRNMLWKTVLRERMGYFERDNSFFLNTGSNIPLKELTYNKLNEALARCESW